MRIERLEIGAYGYLVDRSIPNLSEGLVVVHGLNETGKSTLFSLLTTLLYGFDPVSNFPYHPWHVNRYPELSAVLTLEDSTKTEVWRKLASTPQGRSTRNGHTEKLANHPLPFVQHVNKKLYKALYALTQANMRVLDEAQRKEIEDLLLSGLGAELLNPTRRVIADLEKQAQKLWRSDKRGKPLYVGLRGKLKDARKDRKQAVESDQALRNKAERLHEVQEQIDILERELGALKMQLHKADVLLPMKKQMDRIKAWLSEIPDIEQLQHLPDGLKAEYKRLCERVEHERKAVKDLEKERNAKFKVQEQFSDDDHIILNYTGQIDRWARRVTAHEQEQHNIKNLERAVDDLQQSLESTAESVLSESWQGVFSLIVEKIILPELKARINDFQDKQREAERQKTATESVAPVRMIGELPRWAVLGAIAMGGALILVGIVVSHTAIMLGAPLALIGAAGCFFNFFIRRQNKQQAAQREDQVERLQNKKQGADNARDKTREAIREILKDLPIAPVLLEHPDLTLYQAVERLRLLNGEKKQKTDQLKERREEWNTAQGKLQNLVERLGEHMASPEAINRLESRLGAAKNHQRDFNQASTRIEEINNELKGAEKTLEDATGEHEEFLRHVTQTAAEDLPPDEALERAVKLQEIMSKIQSVESQLELDHPDLAELQEEIHHLEEGNVDAWVLDQEEVEKSRIRLDKLQETGGEIQRLREEEITLQNEIKNARGDVSVGELDGKIENIEEQIEDVCTQHDHLMLLASLLQEADRQFREEHQPDVLKRASEYLTTITGGRYTRIITLEDEEEERLAVISKSGEHRPISFPLSGGTLDQIYLTFRLAVIDHLDEAYEHLPLVLDEVLINWDDQRFETGVQILSHIAQKRQVFLFTCHDWIVKRIQGITGTSPITLDVF
ncbi:MAG: AAA family ATPase [Candidatus Bipolaricaulota bacterium]|nr:AAA family ATPase [Candidatus Bipolaricaulota bacterium]